MTVQLPDVPKVDNPGLYSFLQALKKRLQDTTTDAVLTATGAREPRSFVLDFGGVGDGATSNDAQFAATEAAADSTIYVGDGIFATSRAASALTKAYRGSGLLLLSTAALPADFSYMSTLPTLWPSQGDTGWWRGDGRFSSQRRWRVIGPGVRTYNPTARYFEAPCIPDVAWWDVESGSSGAQAYLTSGATAGASTVTVNGTASAEWVDQQCNITLSFGGAVSETKTVQSVSGSTVTFTTPLSSTYVWNPAASNPDGTPKTPALQFSPRTWGGFRYLRLRARGGGDNYGDAIRINVEYQPKLTELVHTFNGATAGQTGGSVDFVANTSVLTAPASTGSATVTVGLANPTKIVGKRAVLRASLGGITLDTRTVLAATSTTITFDAAPSANHPAGTLVTIGPDGTYATGWESMYNDQGNDVAVQGRVDSFTRQNDQADNGGRVWLGSNLKSDGQRPADATYVVAGRWRRGLDTVTAFLQEGSYLTVAATATNGSITVKWPSGARIGDPVTIWHATTPYSGTITSVTGNVVGVTPNIAATYPIGSHVDFTNGGAAVAMAFGQRISWNTSASDTGRGGDPLGLWGPGYGNVLGDIETGTEADGSSDYWYTKFNGLGHGGATARIRLRPTSFSCNVDILGGNAISAAKELISNGYTGGGTFSGSVVFAAGSGNELRFNTGTNNFEYYKAGVLVASV